MQTPFVHSMVVLAVAAAVAAGPTVTAFADTPVVQGPESVQDWWNAGQQYIHDAKRQIPILRHAKNVILFVGDGMGVSTVTAARILEGQMSGKPGEENNLFFETLPYVALSKTYSWDQQTSDSAPTMTAMVTGYKARESMLSVSHTTPRYECDATVIAANALDTILEQAARHGKSTGVVTTARLTHATPAANYAHTAVRDWESDSEIRSFETNNGLAPNSCTVKDIARQLIELPAVVKGSLKVAMGGGRSYFMRNDQVDQEDGGNNKGRRRDGRDLTAEWVSSRGPQAAFVYDLAGFNAVAPHSTGYLLGLFERSHMEYEYDRPADTGKEPSLTEMTEKAINMLERDRDGFYLLDCCVLGGKRQTVTLPEPSIAWRTTR